MINVIGLGYIGLPTALIMASSGFKVIGTDCNKNLVEILNSGRTTFKEEGMEELFTNALKNEIKFTTEYQIAQIYIISVPTPYDSFTKKVDVSYLVESIKNVMAVCENDSIIVIESTVSPGTIDRFVRPIIKEYEYNFNKKINIAHAPERIIPGNMLNELFNNNRTIGADNNNVGNKIKNLYSRFCNGEIIVTDIKTAEMTKVVENTFRAVNIAFANELAKICRHDNMDVYEIINICNMHPRVNILQPGPGVGGHCISVDPWFLVGDYPSISKLICESMRINNSMPDFVLNRIYEVTKENKITDLGKIGFYGLTYKENVDDIRDSPTLQIIDLMNRHLSGNMIKVYDPYVVKNVVKNQIYNLNEFLDSIDVIVILVAHDEIKKNMNKLKNKIIIDTKNICDFKKVYRL